MSITMHEPLSLCDTAGDCETSCSSGGHFPRGFHLKCKSKCILYAPVVETCTIYWAPCQVVA